MYAINILSSVTRSFSTKIRTTVSSLKHFRRYSYKPKHSTSYDFKTRSERDLVLFRLETPIFFKTINVFSIIQCAFWIYLSVFLCRTLKTTNIPLKLDKFWGKVVEKEKKYADVLAVICIFFGCSVFIATVTYSSRSVRKIILHKGGKDITLITYGLPGYNEVKVPLHNVSSLQHRTKAKKYIPLKIKNNFFHYIIDVTGEFSHPELFDFTAGMKRSFS